MMAQIDSDYAADPDQCEVPLEHIPPDSEKMPADFTLPKLMNVDLIAKVEDVLAGLPEEVQWGTAVDWSYLDKLESGDIDTSQFPEWVQYLLLEIDDPQQEMFLKQYILSHLANPPLFRNSDSEDDEFGSA